MYSPAHYRESRPELAYQLMARFDFATVFSSGTWRGEIRSGRIFREPRRPRSFMGPMPISRRPGMSRSPTTCRRGTTPLSTPWKIFRIEIETLETKLKLSQNHPAPNRNTVMTELEKLGGENQRGVAEWMRKTAPAHSKK